MSISAKVNLSANILQSCLNNVPTETVQAAENELNYQQADKQAKELSKSEIGQLTQKMSRLVELINRDIKFQMHEETKRIMVQVVDSRDGTVLKEFPPHELLDVVAKIEEYVGILLDKKA